MNYKTIKSTHKMRKAANIKNESIVKSVLMWPSLQMDAFLSL